MILVADASALIALSVCNALSLLDALFGEVLVPEAVFNEIAIEGKPESEKLKKYLHGKVRSVSMHNYVYWMHLLMLAKQPQCCFTKRWPQTTCSLMTKEAAG